MNIARWTLSSTRSRCRAGHGLALSKAGTVVRDRPLILSRTVGEGWGEGSGLGRRR